MYLSVRFPGFRTPTHRSTDSRSFFTCAIVSRLARIIASFLALYRMLQKSMHHQATVTLSLTLRPFPTNEYWVLIKSHVSHRKLTINAEHRNNEDLLFVGPPTFLPKRVPGLIKIKTRYHVSNILNEKFSALHHQSCFPITTQMRNITGRREFIAAQLTRSIKNLKMSK